MLRLYKHLLMSPDGDPADGNGGSGKAPAVPAADPKDAEIAALKAKAAEDAAAKVKAETEFEAYKKEREREKMTEQQKLVADKEASDKKAEAAEKARVKAEKETEKVKFGAELVANGLKSMKFVDTLLSERKEGETAEALASRLKAIDEFSGLFGTRTAPAKAPTVPGGTPPKGDPTVPDEDEDDRALRAAFPKDAAAQNAAKAHLKKQRESAAKRKNG